MTKFRVLPSVADHQCGSVYLIACYCSWLSLWRSVPISMQRSATCDTWQTMVYRSSHRQLITANLATGDVVVMDSNSLQYCTQTVIALVYRPRFKITRSIDRYADGLYLQCDMPTVPCWHNCSSLLTCPQFLADMPTVPCWHNYSSLLT